MSFSAALHPATADLRRRERALILGCMAALVGLCWAVLALAHPAPAGVTPAHAHPPGGAGFLTTFAMWQVMMIAMMLPAVLPWVLVLASGTRDGDAGPYVPASAFLGGYLTAWAAYSSGAAALQLGLQDLALLSGIDGRLGPRAGGALLIAAGIFQLSPWKAACLKHCRSPLGYFLSRWRDGAAGAFRMGFGHGLFCLGCCWALMALAFAVGVMNLLWMAALTLLLCLEKIAPGGHRWSRVLGYALLTWGGGQILS